VCFQPHGFRSHHGLKWALIAALCCLASVASAASPQDATRAPESKPEPLAFHGVQIGLSTVADVEFAWGKPTQVAQQNAVLHHTYAVEPFEKIEVTFYQEKVLSLIIYLRQNFPPAVLAEQLDLTALEPVLVPDDSANFIGQIYPERGVSFSFEGPDRQVSQISFDAVDAQPFILRAESHLALDYGKALADLETALKLDPRSARAQCSMAQVLDRIGRSRDALAASQAAVDDEPQNPEYGLTYAIMLGRTGQHEQAVAATEQTIAQCGARLDLKARAISLLGDEVAAGAKRDYKLALDYHMQAIQLAEPLLTNAREAVRRSGRDVLVNAHLAVANDIAWGAWKTKPEVVPKWLDRAQLIARETRSLGGDADDETCKLCQKALSAVVGLGGELDPTPWLDLLIKTSQTQFGKSTDPLFRQHLEWELGLALYDALQAYLMRGDFPAALESGTRAVEHLEHSISGRQIPPSEQYLVGRLYFRMGSIWAIHNKNHAAAVVWFDKALPTLNTLMPVSAWADPGRQGEALVSMSVSYWAVDQQEKALELTEQGVQWMERAAEDGILDKSALAVPYANLARMYGHRGDKKQAQGFQELAARVDSTRRQ
jgi:tetratricopeptide (TPR) repeat protein